MFNLHHHSGHDERKLLVFLRDLRTTNGEFFFTKGEERAGLGDFAESGTGGKGLPVVCFESIVKHFIP